MTFSPALSLIFNVLAKQEVLGLLLLMLYLLLLTESVKQVLLLFPIC